jgi:glycosyltransferase involved in cell wall biosynthesis
MDNPIQSTPLISVIISTYNYGRFLRQCLDSVFAQTVRDFEVIVVDDGSTDDTPAVLGSVTDPRLRHFRTPNGGLPVARNAGLREARGEFVAFIDADDRWRPQILETLLSLLLAEPSVGAVFSDFVRFNENGFLPNQFSFFPELPSVPTRAAAHGNGRVIVGDAFTILLAFSQFPVYLWSGLFRRSLLADLEFPVSLKKSQDLYYAMRIYERTEVAFVDDILLEVRRHGSNLSKDLFQKKLWDIRALEFLEREVLPMHKKAVRNRIGRIYASVGHQLFWEKKAWQSAGYYLKSLAYPGRRANALLHMMAIPAIVFLPRKQSGH